VGYPNALGEADNLAISGVGNGGYPDVNVRFAETFRGLGTAFRDRNLRRLQTAWALAWVVDWAYFVGLGIYAYERGGAVAVGLAGLIRMAPAAAIAPFASLLGDRYRRLRMLLVNQLVWTAALAASALAFFWHAPTAVVYALAGVTGVCSTIIRPTLAALLPWLAETPEQLVAANAALTTIESLGTLIGPLLGGLVVAALQPGAVFTVCAGASAFASLAFAMTRTEGEQVRRGEVGGGLVREAFAGFGLLVRDRDVGLAVLLGGAQTVVRGALNVLIVVAALGTLHMGSSGVGILTAAIGAGGLVGSLVAVNLVGRRLAVPLAIGLILWGLPIAAIGGVPHPVAAVAFLAILGGGNALFDVATYTILQRLVPDEYLSRIMGLLFGLVMATVAIGSIAVPPLIESIGIRPALLVVGAFLPLVTVISLRRLLAIDRRAPVHTEEVALLRSVPMFASLSVAASEYLAKNAEEVEVHAGRVLISEGETGDRFYVVSHGQFDVSRSGRRVSTQGAGGFFGEMALLRDIPRQATVKATEDSSVYAFRGKDFIAAVTGHCLSDRTAQDLVEARLSENIRRDKTAVGETEA
jgi:CRP-like cAMP-binding protein